MFRSGSRMCLIVHIRSGNGNSAPATESVDQVRSLLPGNDFCCPATFFVAPIPLRYHAAMLIVLVVAYALVVAWVAWRRRQLLWDVLVPGVLGVFTILFFWRIVSGDAYRPADGGDLGSFLFPTYTFIQHSLRSGVWPLWNPHIYSGVPFVAEIQSGLFYPPHLLRFLIGPELRYTDMQSLVLLHVWWAGVTSYALGRGIGLRRWPALFAATAFMFSDLFLVHFGNLNLAAVASWLPLALLGVHRTLEHGRLRPALGAGLALGIGALAGHVQMTLYSLMAVAMWVGLWLVLGGSEGSGRWRRAAMALFVPVVITLGLAAPLLLPGWELSRMVARTEWRYADTVGYSLSPPQLIGLLMPGFFGRGPALHWGVWPRVEMGYLGVLTLVLALVAVFMRRNRLTWLLAGLAVLALVFSLGVYGSVHGWFTWLLPGLAQLRAPARFIFVFDLSVALLAGVGLQALLDAWTEPDRRGFESAWRLLCYGLIAVVAVGLPITFAALLLTSNDADLQWRISATSIAVTTFVLLMAASLALLYARRQQWARSGILAGLAVALLLIDLASLGAYDDVAPQDPTRTYDHPALLNFLRSDPDLFRIDGRTDIDAFWQPDAALQHGLYDVWGVANPLVLTSYVAFWDATGSRSSDLYALLNTKYVLGRKDVVLDGAVWELAFDGDPDLNVYRSRSFQPRAHLYGNALPAATLAEAQVAIRALEFKPLTEVVVEAGTAQQGPAGTAQMLSFGINDVVVSTESPVPGTLLVAQTWYPGWEASIDGGTWQPVLRADGALQAVQLTAGRHEVHLRFRSRPLVWGLVIASITLAAVLVAFVLTSPRRGRRRPAGP